jgi:hypothetical protein
LKRTIVVFASLVMFTALAAFTPPAAHARMSTRKSRIQACTDKNSGDPCTYTKKGEDVNGTCTQGHHGKLICTASAAGTEAPGGAMNPPAPAPGGDTGTPPPPAGGSMGSPGSEGGGGEAPPASAP